MYKIWRKKAVIKVHMKHGIIPNFHLRFPHNELNINNIKNDSGTPQTKIGQIPFCKYTKEYANTKIHKNHIKETINPTIISLFLPYDS